MHGLINYLSNKDFMLREFQHSFCCLTLETLSYTHLTTDRGSGERS